MKATPNQNSRRSNSWPRPSRAMVCSALAASLLFALGLGGCDRHDSTTPAAQTTPKPDDQTQSQAAAPQDVSKAKSNIRQVIILNRLAKQDPAHLMIDRATITDQNEVGVIISKSVEMDKVPDLMKSIVDRLAKEFPQEDVTLVAYASSDPSHKLGKAQRNAKTNETSYTPETN